MTWKCEDCGFTGAARNLFPETDWDEDEDGEIVPVCRCPDCLSTNVGPTPRQCAED